MSNFPTDIFTEPNLDPDGIANLGPLSGMAGIWEGATGMDTHPVVEGTEPDSYVERYELQPIDPQTNGPQFFYGLRYHTHITKPGDIETFHDQVGYWLWEPATGSVIQTIAIPRGQVAMASGTATADTTTFELRATAGSEFFGILSNPFLDHAYRTSDFRITVTIGDGSWSYEEHTTLHVHGRAEPFDHSDRHTLKRVGDPTPNPLANLTARQTD
jgi:hypothetical protein